MFIVQERMSSNTWNLKGDLATGIWLQLINIKWRPISSGIHLPRNSLLVLSIRSTTRGKLDVGRFTKTSDSKFRLILNFFPIGAKNGVEDTNYYGMLPTR